MQNARLMKHKLKSRLLGEIITSDMQMTPHTFFMAESKEEQKSLLMKVRKVKKLASSSTFRKLRS